VVDHLAFGHRAIDGVQYVTKIHVVVDAVMKNEVEQLVLNRLRPYELWVSAEKIKSLEQNRVRWG